MTITYIEVTACSIRERMAGFVENPEKTKVSDLRIYSRAEHGGLINSTDSTVLLIQRVDTTVRDIKENTHEIRLAESPKRKEKLSRME